MELFAVHDRILPGGIKSVNVVSASGPLKCFLEAANNRLGVAAVVGGLV